MPRNITTWKMKSWKQLSKNALDLQKKKLFSQFMKEVEPVLENLHLTPAIREIRKLLNTSKSWKRSACVRLKKESLLS